MDWGVFAVDGFFILSGYLITQSWLRDPRLGDYLLKRILRIVPGYLVAALVSVIAVGIFAPAVHNYFHGTFGSSSFWISIAALEVPRANGFPGSAISFANGSLWTIKYEFICYLLVALFGVCRLFRWPAVWLASTVFLFAVWLSPSLQMHLSWHRWIIPFGRPLAAFTLYPGFFLGGCFALYRDRVAFRPLFAVIAAAGLLVVPHLVGTTAPWFVLFGSYLLLYLARQPLAIFHRWHGLPDLSYGTYLYGWPIQGFLIWGLHLNFYWEFLIASAISLCLAWLSWTFIEKPALQLKPGRRVALPAA
jgi:peptidoglycan/LPS O-acetylase OafA/YrhL